jgi:hypothetical protein
VNADGTDPAPLVESGRIFNPTCSPEGQWVVFNQPPAIRRIPLSGGTPQSLGDFVVQSGLAYSPDGRTIASIVLVRKAQGSPPARRMLALITPGSAPRFIDTNQ